MLKHNNIVPLLGITFDFGPNNPMGMVCPWLENGNLNGYLERRSAALMAWDPFQIVSGKEDSLLQNDSTYISVCI
jgi:hypothetical protein